MPSPGHNHSEVQLQNIHTLSNITARKPSSRERVVRIKLLKTSQNTSDDNTLSNLYFYTVNLISFGNEHQTNLVDRSKILNQCKEKAINKFRPLCSVKTYPIMLTNSNNRVGKSGNMVKSLFIVYVMRTTA